MSEESGLTQRHGDTKSLLKPNQITELVLGAAIEIHQELGPGLLESVYETILIKEIERRGLRVEAQVELPVIWKGEVLGQTFRIDLLIEGRVIVELKSVEKSLPVHKKQVLTYMKLSGIRLGLLINFGLPVLKDGIERIIWGDPHAL